MKNLKNILLITSVSLLGFTQLSKSGYQTGSAVDGDMSLNDSTIQVLLTKVSQLQDEVYATKAEIKKIKGLQEYIPTGVSLTDLETMAKELNSKVYELGRKDSELEDKIQSIKGTSFSTPSIESLERKIDDLKRSSHSH